MELVNISTRDDGTLNVPSNSKTELLHNAMDLGVKEGHGLNARPMFARAVIAASVEGTIASKDASEVWDAYWRGMKAANYGTAIEFHETMNTAQAAVRASEVGRFIVIGAMHKAATFNALAFFDRAVELINGSTVKGSTYQNLVAVMRAKCNDPEKVFDDAAIMLVINPPDEKAKVKNELDQLTAIVKAMKVLKDGTKATEKTEGKTPHPSVELAQAYALLTMRLATLVAAKSATDAAIAQKAANALSEAAAKAAVEAAKIAAQQIEDGEHELSDAA